MRIGNTYIIVLAWKKWFSGLNFFDLKQRKTIRNTYRLEHTQRINVYSDPLAIHERDYFFKKIFFDTFIFSAWF